MPLIVKHSKVSPVADGLDTDLVRPSDWNADHQITGLDSITELVAVSVNSTSPALKITQTGTGNALLVEDSASTDSSPFVIDADGRVVSGHTTTSLIQARTYQAQFMGSGVDYPLAAGYTGASATGPRFALVKNRAASWSSQASVLSGDTLGEIDFVGSDGTNTVPGARITASVDGTPGANDMPGRLIFSTTAAGASSPTERMRIDRIGQVSVTANNSTSALKITQTGTGNALVVEDSASTDSTPFVIDQNGKVLVGATSSTNQSAGPANVQSTALTAFGGLNTGADTTPAIVELSKSRSGAIALSGDQVGQLRFSAFDGAGYMRTAQITSEVDGTPGPNDMPGRLVFSTTADNSSTPVERMRITSAGDVLFGSPTKDSTSTVIAAYQINAGTGTGASLGQYAWNSAPGACPFHTFNKSRGASVGTRGAVAAGDELGNIYFSGDDGTNFVRGVLLRAIVDGTPSTGVIPGAFAISTTAVGGAGPAERLRIDSSGNVLVKYSTGLGYGTGAGGQVTQTGSRTTGVTLSKPTGAITLVSAAGSTAWQSFTVTNTVVAAEDVVVVSQKSGADLYEANVTNVAAGSFRISFRTTGGTTTEQPVFSFAIIKGAIA